MDEQKPITVTLPAVAWNVVGAGLGKLLHEVSAPVFDEIRRQVNGALTASPEPSAEPAPLPDLNKDQAT